MLKNISIIFSTREQKFCISRCHVMFYLLYKHQWSTKPCNFFLAVKGAIYHFAKATVIFSRVKRTCYFHMWRSISCVRAKAHLVFHWCLYNKLWYVTLGARGFFLSYFLIVCGVKLALSLSTASSQYPALGKDNIETTKLQNFSAPL